MNSRFAPPSPRVPAPVAAKAVSDEVLIATYEATGSVWKTGKQVGLSGQTVHERLTRLGKVKPIRVLTEPERELIRALYRDGFLGGDGKLDALAAQIGRTKHFICRFARTEKLTSYSRKVGPSALEKMSSVTRERWQRQPHPRGALGMKHDEGTRMQISWASRAANDSRSDEQRSQIAQKSLRTRIKNGTLVNPRQKVTWKQGWREIAGTKIYFRSRWEFNYAVYLQWLVERKQILKWEHEPETFWFDGIKRGCVTYLPDFRVTNPDGSIEYHEVKGWMDPRSKTKLKRMKKYHPTVKLRVIDGKWFKANGPKLSWLKGWES